MVGKSALITWALSAGFCVLLAGAASAEDTVQSLYAAAKKEGAVVYWSSMDVKANETIGKDFAKRFPGIRLQVFKIEPGPAIERIITESQAGRLEADVVDSPLGYLSQLTSRNLLDSYPWDKVFGLEPTKLMFGGRVLEYFNLDTPIAYNTTLVQPGEIKSWDDLLQPRWRGKVILEARGIEFPVLAEKWGEPHTFDYLHRLLANAPIIIQGGTPTGEALAGGQGAIALGTYGGRILQYKKEGAPIDWARVSPIPAMIYVAGVLKGAPHPAAAKLWTYFLTTPPAQKDLYETQGFGMLTGKNMSPLGQEMQAAGIQVILESPDIEHERQLLAQTGDIIRGRK